MNLDLTCSLSQLQLDCGPISGLPNELVQSILARVDMQQLVHLRVVCKKWHSVICSIGHNKKAFCFTSCGPYSLTEAEELKKRSFGQINLASTFTKFKLKQESARHHLAQSQLVHLFPRIESLVLDLLWNDSLTVLRHSPLHQLTTLSITHTFGYDFYYTSRDDYQQLLPLINLCVSLKRLDISGRIKCAQLSALAPTLARLRQFSYSSYYEPALVHHFGSNCSHVSLDIVYNTIFYEADYYTQWHSMNRGWLANVTHLELNNIPEFDRLVDYLSRHAATLQVLRLKANPYAPMTTQLIRHLSKLEHLTELGLTHIRFDLSRLEQSTTNYELIPLVSIQTVTLSSCDFKGEKDFNRFTSVLCNIFPNAQCRALECALHSAYCANQ